MPGFVLFFILTYDSISAIIIILRVTLDTNVIYQALRTNSGASHKILNMVRNSQLELSISIPVFNEYADVLSRKKTLHIPLKTATHSGANLPVSLTEPCNETLFKGGRFQSFFIFPFRLNESPFN